jgi:microcystin-dependent protein
VTDQFLGEIRIVGFNFAPTGWALCNGQVMPISQNTALFSLLGTNYGGDGRSTFALPNLQAQAPMHWGQGAGLSARSVGESGGSDTVALLAAEMPTHQHAATAVAASGTTNSPGGAAWAEARFGRAADQIYSNSATGAVAMSPNALATAGGGAPHNNMPPYLGMNFIIALQGIFPPRG